MVANANIPNLSLDDIIEVLDVRKIRPVLRLDTEKINWLNMARESIYRYVNNRVSIREMDNALEIAAVKAQVQNLGNAHYFRSRDLQLLSLRNLKLSDKDIRMIEKIKSSKAEALSNDPNIGNMRLYLAAERFNYLYVGIVSPLTTPYGIDFEGGHILKIFFSNT